MKKYLHWLQGLSSPLSQCEYFLSVKETQLEKLGIFISHKKYTKHSLKKFNMSNCNLVTTPVEVGMKLWRCLPGTSVDPTLYKSLVRSLRYLPNTRFDVHMSMLQLLDFIT